jgi:hypothetical protein
MKAQLSRQVTPAADGYDKPFSQRNAFSSRKTKRAIS